MFRDVITSLDSLREVVGQPSDLVIQKQLSQLDTHARAFMSLSPFLLLATADKRGHIDVSPRGDAPGFVLVLDSHRLVIPERKGNRRVDSLKNILENPQVGLLFCVPGYGETLRVNGSAALIRDADILQRCAVGATVPLLGIAVHVEECFFHCARAMLRSKLWEHEEWVNPDVLPTLAQILMEQVNPTDYTSETMQQMIDDAYRRLY